VSVLVVPAKNLEMLAILGTTSTVVTDSIPLGHNDRATVEFKVSVLGTTGVQAIVKYFAEASFDGNAWLPIPGLGTGLTIPDVVRQTAPAHGALIRFHIDHFVAVGGPGDIAWATIDLHVFLDHA
jgi:hypothetical protein